LAAASKVGFVSMKENPNPLGAPFFCDEVISY